MRRYTYIIYAVVMLFMVACNSRRSSGDVFKEIWRMLLIQIHCVLTRFTILRQKILRMVTCHLHHQTDAALTGHHLHRLMARDIPTMSLTTCAALTLHLRMTWMTTA